MGGRGYHVISSYQPTLLGILLSCVSWYSECYLDTTVFQEKWLFSGVRLVAWLETLVLSESLVSFNIFYSCHFGIFLIWLSKKLYCERCAGFFCQSYINSFFPGTARLWNSLCLKCFVLKYDVKFLLLELLDAFYLWTLFKQFSYMLLFFFLFLIRLCLIVTGSLVNQEQNTSSENCRSYFN